MAVHGCAQCRSHYRWSAVDARGLALLSEDAQAAGRPVTPFERLAANQTELVIERTLAELAPPLREALVLVAIERMSPGEAAGVLRIRADTMRQRLRRARLAVSQALQSDHDVRELP